MRYLSNRRGMLRVSVVAAVIWVAAVILHAAIFQRDISSGEFQDQTIIGAVAILIIVNLIPWAVSGFRNRN